MPINLKALEPGQIVLLTIAATIIASIVGAITAFVVATVNAYAASRLARESAKRDHRLRTITPYLEHLDKRIALYRELMDAGPILSTALRKTIELVKSEQEQKAQKVQELMDPVLQRLRDIPTRMTSSKAVYDSAGWFSFVSSDQRVLDRQHDWLDKDLAFWESFASVGGFTANPEKLKQLSKRASEALDGAVSARRAIEDFVFGGRRWIQRSLHYVWSKLRDAWERHHPHGRPKADTHFDTLTGGQPPL
jgi:hypothetical protein